MGCSLIPFSALVNKPGGIPDTEWLEVKEKTEGAIQHQAGSRFAFFKLFS